MPKKKTDEIDIPSFDKILADMNKRYGAGSFSTLDKVGYNVEKLPTGIKTLDDALEGGLPKGRILDFYGVPSGGKSLISLQAIKQAQIRGLKCVYFDCEHSLDPSFATRVGVDVSQLAISRESLGENVMDMIIGILPTNPGIIVLDSVPALVTISEIEASMEQQFMAPRARLMANSLKKIIEKSKDTIMIFINQLRASTKPYTPLTYSTGGNALQFASSVRLEVVKGDLITDDGLKTGTAIGQMIKFKVEKSKTSTPKRVGSFKFFYADGRIE